MSTAAKRKTANAHFTHASIAGLALHHPTETPQNRGGGVDTLELITHPAPAFLNSWALSASIDPIVHSMYAQ